MIQYLIAGAVMGGMGLVLALVLAYADKKLYVYEDPRIDEVEALLPKANCGACGCAGCRSFAEKAVNGEIAPGRCTVNSAENIVLIASLLKVDAGSEEKRVARLACAGGAHVAKRRVNYSGVDSCRAAVLVAGGGKGCSWGCLGLADCKVACTFDAIHMDSHGLPVVDEQKCTACGDCVTACPKDLFSLHPISHRLWVACQNLLGGELAEADCEVACTACGRCAADAPAGLIHIDNNLAVIDYTKNRLASRTPIERCPTGAIVWLNATGLPTRGVDSKRITRKSALPVDVTALPVTVGAAEGRHL